MLDANLKAQLQAYLEKVTQEIDTGKSTLKEHKLLEV